MVKDIVEEAIEDKLDNNHFPSLGGQRQNSKGAAPTSNRYGNWHKDKKDQTATKTVPRILVFIAGGTCYSEMRAGYEVSSDKKNWEIVMGEWSETSYTVLNIIPIFSLNKTFKLSTASISIVCGLIDNLSRLNSEINNLFTRWNPPHDTGGVPGDGEGARWFW